jgi:hypothetical protein
MSNRQLSDADIQRFLDNLLKVEMELHDTPYRHSRQQSVCYMTAGDIDRLKAVLDLRLIIAERDALKAQVDRLQASIIRTEVSRTKTKPEPLYVACIGSKLTVAADGTVTVEGGTVEVNGSVHVQGVA